ncbi:uncharacterized protein LOC123548636 isoform X2 [Mercenaria mercenaria]|uniref:uncharacterized protein LOC123548636 isoform X2 n=1 Tax=Mercenaria mercenaria TaxID=6596 RepID=UPI00234E9BEE|nr:uncharacterized protein LOC123548636 isoform X2 [Mercenaria mercenaria]
MTGDQRAYEYEAYIETRRDHLNPKSDSGIQEVSEAGQVRNDQMSKMAKVGQEWNQIDTDNIQELEKSRDLTNEEGMEMQHESENDEDMKRDRIKICDTVRSEFNDISSKTCNVGGTLNGEDMVQKTEDTTQLGQNSNDVGTGGNGLVSLPRFSNLAKSDTSETHVSEVKEPFIRLTVDDEEFGSAFGIMSVYCDSELHTAWKGEREFQDR